MTRVHVDAMSCCFPRTFPPRLVPAVLAVLTAAPAAHAQTQNNNAPVVPEFSAAGSVTLPLPELRALWIDAHRAANPPPAAPPPPPPMPYALQSARYTLELIGPDKQQAHGQVKFEVLVLNPEGWTTVPLLRADEGARLTGIEPADALLAVRDGALTLLLDHPGRHVVTLRFDAELTRPPGNNPAPAAHPTLRLSLPPALVNELTVSDPPGGFLVEVNGRAATPGNPLPLAAGQPLALTLMRAEERRPAPPPAPSRWRVETQSLVRFDEGRLLYRTRLRADTISGAGLALNLQLPAAANVLGVEGADLDRWRAARSDESRRLEILWKTPDTSRREVFVTYEVPQPALEGEWPLAALSPAPEATENGGTLAASLFVLPAIPGLEFAGTAGEPAGGGSGDPRTLPRWLAEGVGGESFFTVASPAAAVRTRRLPLVRTAAATVEEARYRTRLVADGATLTEGTLAVRHDAPFALNFTLPEHTQLLTCAVDGRDAAPVDRGNGRVELPLPINPHAGKPTRVAFSYAGRERPLVPTSGRAAMALPETDLFIQALWWDLQIPDAYEVEDLDGNVHRDESAAAAPPAAGTPVPIHLRKELIRAERPAVELFYQKRALAP